MAGTCECANEPSGSIKCGEFLAWLRTGWLLRGDSAAWLVVKYFVCAMSLFSLPLLHVCSRAMEGTDSGSQFGDIDWSTIPFDRMKQEREG